VVGDLNRRLRGWANYFRWGNSTEKFAHIDQYVHQRLAIWMGKKHKLRPRRNWRRFNSEWHQGIGVYQLVGKARPYPVHA
jgi:hypothetical protein